MLGVGSLPTHRDSTTVHYEQNIQGGGGSERVRVQRYSMSNQSWRILGTPPASSMWGTVPPGSH